MNDTLQTFTTDGTPGEEAFGGQGQALALVIRLLPTARMEVMRGE